MFSAFVHLYGLNWLKLKVCRERVSHLMSYSLEVSCTTPAGSSNVCVVNKQQTHISNMKQQGCGLLSSFSKGVMEFDREVWHPRPREACWWVMQSKWLRSNILSILFLEAAYHLKHWKLLFAPSAQAHSLHRKRSCRCILPFGMSLQRCKLHLGKKSTNLSSCLWVPDMLINKLSSEQSISI